jgi:HSP90 family molecular chaperone
MPQSNPLTQYQRLVGTGDKEYTIELNEEQRAAILALYDNGIRGLKDDQVAAALDALVCQLKDQIWP